MGKENKAILEGDLYYVQGSYAAISDAVGFDLPKNYTQTQEALSAQIQNDMHRTTFFMQDEKERETLERQWFETKHDVLQSYDQADPTGSPIPNHLYLQRLHKINSNLSGNDLLRAQESFLTSRENMRFGYLDDNNKVCGVYIAYSKDPKEPGWVMGVLHDAIASPTDRKLHLFTFLPNDWIENPIDKKKLSKLHPVKVSNQITSKKIFPRKVLPFQPTLKEALNSEKVYLFLENMLNADGTIKPDFFDKQNLEQKGYQIENTVIIHPPVPKKPEDTVTPSATPLNAKTNANVTAFIQKPQYASEINQAIASRNFVLSEDRHFFVNKKDGREIHIGLQGQMTTDPINTATTPNPSQAALDVLIVALRTLSVIYHEGGKDNFPAEKFALKLTQREGATENQKANFLRFEKSIREGLADEINSENPDIYAKEFLEKITFNGMKLDANLKKRPTPDDKEKEETDETDEAKATEGKRLKLGK